jgi:hypothetical protein
VIRRIGYRQPHTPQSVTDASSKEIPRRPSAEAEVWIVLVVGVLYSRRALGLKVPWSRRAGQ